MAALPVAACLLFAGCGEDAKRDEEGTVVESGDESVYDLKVGDCWDAPPEDVPIGWVTAIPCAEPHDAEVYFDYETDLARFPGDLEMFDVAADGCLVEFDAFVGLPYEESELDILALYPTAESWGAGDRVVSCSVYAIDESKLTGSMRGSQR